MPQGPGDEILDEIEKGTNDAALIKKYKINADQLKSFKSLHYGLSNQKMSYDEINDYFPELNSYFKPPLAPSPASQPAIEKPDFTKPVKEKVATESTNVNNTAIKDLAQANKPKETTAEHFGEKIKKSNELAKKTLLENDDVIVKLIKEGRYRQEQEKRLNEFAAGPRTDMPAAQALALQRQMALEPEIKPQDIPVKPEEVEQSKAEINSNEQQARHFMREVAKAKPEKAKEIQTSMYMLDAAERIKANPEIGTKVYQNLDKLNKGEINYDPATGSLVRKEGFWDALVSGVKSRTQQMKDYDLFQQPKEKVIELMEQRLKNYDPDEPVSMPKGIGEIGQMAGMEWASLLKGSAVGATVGRIAPGAAPYITAAISAPEYYKRGYSTAFDETYRQLRAEGKSPDEAYEKATAQAKDEAKYSAAEGAVSTLVGSRIGMKDLPKFNITGGFKNAAAQVLKNTAHYGAEVGIEGLADGMVAAYLQDQKDMAAGEKGIFRTEGYELKENLIGELTFSLAMGAVTKVGEKVIDPKTYSKLLYYLGKQPKETVDAKIGDMVIDGQLTEDQANEAKNKIDAQREVDKTVPENIKDVSRQAMIEKINRRNELQKELETKDEALHPPIKEEIKKLNEEILEHSKHVKPENQAEEAEASEQPEQPAVSTEQTEPGAASTGLEDQAAPGITEPQTEQNAIQEQSPTGLHVSPPSGDSTEMGKGNESQGPINEEATGKSAQKITPQQQAFYQTSIGGIPNQSTGRIAVDPIVGGTAKEVDKIIGDVSKGLKQRLIYAKPGSRGAIGAYLPGFKGIKIRYNNDLDTTAHELGHAIDDQFDIYTKAAKDPAVVKEWEEFAQHGGSNPPSNHPDPVKYKLKEGFAEWLRGYVLNPKEAERLAPATTALFKQSVNDKFQKVIENFSNDIRTWAGAEGKDITMANVEFEPDKKPGILNDLFKRQQTNNNFNIGWWDRVAANFLNPLQAFEKAFKYARGIQGDPDILPENDPIILSRILLGIDGKFGELLKSGMVDGRGNVLTDENGNPMNLNWLLEPFDNTDMKSIKRDMKDTIAFMISQRVELDLSKRFEQGEILSGAGAGIYTDFQIAQKTLNELYNGDQNRLARIQEAAKRYRDFSKSILQYAVDKGRLSQDQYNAITEENEYYVAFQRILETEPDQELIAAGPQARGTELGSTTDIIHALKGSSKKIKNPYSSLLETMYKTIRESDRNDVMRAFTEILHNPRYSNEGQPKRISDIGIRGNEGDKETISVFRNGKAEKWIFQKNVYKQLKSLDKEAYRLPGLVTAPARLLRAFTTKFPVFAARNWIRDTQDRIIKTTTGSGFKELVGKREDWNAIARAGGLNSGYYFKDKNHYYGLLWEAMDVMAKDKKFILADPVMLKHVWNKYEDLLYKSETSNRVAEYRSAFKEAKQKGMDNYNASIYAAYKARDLIDFAIMGHWMKIINQIIPFSNAAVQGLRSAAVSIKNDPHAFLDRLVIYSIAPQIAAWFWNHRNDDDEKQYEEHPSYVRDMFWNFRIGPDKWLSIPKPYELSLPAAGIDRILSYNAGNKKAFDQYDKSVRKLLLPFDDGNIAGPYEAIIEGLANYDFWRERTIIPPDEDALNLVLRHTETASRLGQLLQKAIGIDARKIDHFIKRQFSYTGAFAEKLSDIGKEDSRQEFDLTDTGFFKRTPAYSSKSVQDMIAFAKEWGLTKSPAYKGFNKIVGAYFDAETPEERERIADEMIEFSKQLLEAWEKENVSQFQEERAEAKKEAGR